MSNSKTSRAKIADWLGLIKVIAGVVLLAAISWEIIVGDHIHFSNRYLTIQLVVCIIFLCDFFIRWSIAEHKAQFFINNLLFFLISIPYLNFFDWSGTVLPRDWAMFMGLMPLLRAFLAMIIIIRWLVTDRISKLFVAYVFTVVVFTYISALIFYDYEVLVNAKLDGFGNALWWAWMNVTTVGGEIFAVTTIGKITTVILPILGMLMLPIFTTYIMQEYTHKNKKSSANE